MGTNDKGLDLSVTMTAAELGALKRRIRYLEATLVQVMRGGRNVKEWFTAAELEALHLPGVGATKAVITRHAREQGWRTRPGIGAHEYHFSTLPRRAFEAMIDRVIAPGVAADHGTPEVPTIAPAPIRAPAVKDTTPPWLLPLMRMVRCEAPTTVREAMDMLPRYVQKGVPMPTLEEATEALRNVGSFLETTYGRRLTWAFRPSRRPFRARSLASRTSTIHISTIYRMYSEQISVVSLCHVTPWPIPRSPTDSHMVPNPASGRKGPTTLILHRYPPAPHPAACGEPLAAPQIIILGMAERRFPARHSVECRRNPGLTGCHSLSLPAQLGAKSPADLSNIAHSVPNRPFGTTPPQPPGFP